MRCPRPQEARDEETQRDVNSSRRRPRRRPPPPRCCRRAAQAQKTAAEKPVKKVHWDGGKRPEKTPLFSGIVSYGGLVFVSGIGAHFEGDIKAHTAARARRDEEAARVGRLVDGEGAEGERLPERPQGLRRDERGVSRPVRARAAACARRLPPPAASRATRWWRSTASRRCDSWIRMPQGSCNQPARSQVAPPPPASASLEVCEPSTHGVQRQDEERPHHVDDPQVVPEVGRKELPRPAHRGHRLEEERE